MCMCVYVCVHAVLCYVGVVCVCCVCIHVCACACMLCVCVLCVSTCMLCVCVCVLCVSTRMDVRLTGERGNHVVGKMNENGAILLPLNCLSIMNTNFENVMCTNTPGNILAVNYGTALITL